MRNILFRVDSSSSIGTGHIMRDLVLAEQYQDADITFATQDLPGNINHKIKEKNYKIEILESNFFEELDSLIKRFDIDLLIIDHYGIDYGFEKKIKSNNLDLKIFVLDDTYEKHHSDILLNHNVYGKELLYEDLVPSTCELRCGAKHTLLRDEFIIEKQKGRQNKGGISNLNVFTAMGGADHSSINIDILNVLRKFTNIHTHVVTTTANSHLDELKIYVENLKNVTLHINTTQIAKLMNEADFAIITPSVTINEIFYLNIPFIAIKTADNQNYMYDYLIENNYKVCQEYNNALLSNFIKNILKELN